MNAPDAREIERVISIIRPIMEELLDQSSIEDDDDFFWLGGDSAVALLFAEKVSEAGLVMPRTAIFDFPTVRSLAVAIITPGSFEK